ncbi:hypothetical protein [Bradyrhizobium sp. BWA-3-5]|uniref:hypothetical protein n=1 Tax=Bradyrhizobium sp. BWA-3-5 TaxID=3080013 RepID=UPI00293F0EE4|nr:hypothetical protein [Bradyrhizobium sp. BWA-3-5]WOH68659.1 hypothetical protein RX331_13525 [Bradyrhizobium sp. BWA-3-5]
MATVAQNITTITTQAAVLDSLVTQFLAAKALIDTAENEIRQAQPTANHHARAGRIRLALYAHALMGNPGLNGGKTVAALAAEAWTGVS